MPVWCIIFTSERNEILFPQSPGREIICHASLLSISPYQLNKFVGATAMSVCDAVEEVS